MAPKGAADETASAAATFTDTEMRFIKAVFDNMTQRPDSDWDKVAEAMSLKDAKCAKERWRQVTVRHGWRGEANGTGPSPRKPGSAAKVAKKPRTPRKKGVKDQDDIAKDEGDNEGHVNEEI